MLFRLFFFDGFSDMKGYENNRDFAIKNEQKNKPSEDEVVGNTCKSWLSDFADV